MGFFGKLLGKKESPPVNPPAVSPPPPGAPAMLKVWDAYGRILQIPREEWRTKVLPGNFRNAWNKPNELANLIQVTLGDGFVADCLEPARQLHRIDPQPKRGSFYLAVVLLQLKRFVEAEKVITEAIRKHGEEGVLLTNLAKAYSGKGDVALSEQTLWHALELDPNQDNGFIWYQAIHRERGGDAAADAAMQRVAALPGSWRPQLWLAREALKSRNSDAALALYRESLSRVGKPVPADLLMQISGDLGNAGFLPEILQFVEPHFDPAFHGLQVGNNLIKAHCDMGQLDAARQVVNQLYAQKRPDWRENLGFWDAEIAKSRLETTQPEKADQLQCAVLTINGPVWLDPSSPAAELFPVPTGQLVSVAFIGGSADVATNSQRVQKQMSDGPGRLSRSLPLFLAEQMGFCSNVKTQTLILWITGDSPGFVLAGGITADDSAAGYARDADLKSDYVVITHIKPIQEPWTVELRLVRTIDAKCLGTLTASFPSAKPQEGIPKLAKELLDLLRDQAEVRLSNNSLLYQVPSGQYLSGYMLRLEQLLAVRCAGMDGVPPDYLSGEREIIDGNIHLCLEHPQNVGVRILLAQTLKAMKRARPTIQIEFKDRIALLQKEKSLPEPANGIVTRILNEAIGA